MICAIGTVRVSIIGPDKSKGWRNKKAGAVARARQKSDLTFACQFYLRRNTVTPRKAASPTKASDDGSGTTAAAISTFISLKVIFP